jgi:uncharacterized membrane protein YraQ (UPF0718 family)
MPPSYIDDGQYVYIYPLMDINTNKDSFIMSTTNCCETESSSACCEPTQETDSKCCDSNISLCCSPNYSEDCCPPVEKSQQSTLRSTLLIFAFISTFLISDYLIPQIFMSKKLIGSVRLQESVTFFLSHSLGLLGLLGAITSLAVFGRSFIDAEKVRGHMSKISDIKGHGLAAGIGMATPFCSCSAVPVFTGFVRSGVPVSQAISFLVASPLVNEIAVIMLATWAGWAIAGAYAGAGFLIAMVAGISLKKFAKPELTTILPARNLLTMVDSQGNQTKPSFAQRIEAATSEAIVTMKKTWIYVLIGVGVGAAIHGWVPVSAIEKLDSFGPVVGVLVATLIGMPLYSGVATVIPVISALGEKGMPTGTLLAFAMSVTGLSLPEAMLLRSVMKPKLLSIYFATVAIGIVTVGIVFNLVIG